MITKQEFNGYWNLPNIVNPTPGLLTFDPFTNPQLQLIGN